MEATDSISDGPYTVTVTVQDFSKDGLVFARLMKAAAAQCGGRDIDATVDETTVHVTFVADTSDDRQALELGHTVLDAATDDSFTWQVSVSRTVVR